MTDVVSLLEEHEIRETGLTQKRRWLSKLASPSKDSLFPIAEYLLRFKRRTRFGLALKKRFLVETLWGFTVAPASDVLD